MLRRLAAVQPESFAFTPANQAWAEVQITKYPEGRQASAIIPLLWRAQEQEGWLSKPAIEHVADMLGLAYIRALEVATFYFMFQLQPVGRLAHVQICGTTSCMICGAEDLVDLCRKRIAPRAHQLSADGRFSWEEVECLGACSNAPMAQIGKDYYEDLTPERLGELLDELVAGKVPVPGPQNGRYSSEPLTGLSSLAAHFDGRERYNASAQAAVELNDTIKRIDGTEVALVAPWQGDAPAAAPSRKSGAEPKQARSIAPSGQAATAPAEAPRAARPAALSAARAGKADDLKLIKGIGPKLEKLCHKLGFFHYDQIAGWTADEIAWVDANLEGFKGRVTRDDWVAQARDLAAKGSRRGLTNGPAVTAPRTDHL